jgi:hypothetical protein
VDLHTTEYGQLNCLFENAPLSFAGRDFPAWAMLDVAWLFYIRSAHECWLVLNYYKLD